MSIVQDLRARADILFSLFLGLIKLHLFYGKGIEKDKKITVICKQNCFQSPSNFFPLLTVEVEPQYSGARIEGDVVTIDFVKKMMDDFKNQKSLHRRYVSETRLIVYSSMLILYCLVVLL